MSFAHHKAYAVTVAAIVAGALLTPFLEMGDSQAIFYDALSLGVCAIAFVGARMVPSERRRPWYFVVAGCGALFAGNVTWDIYETVTGSQAPLPSVADALYLSAYVLFGYAVYELVGTRTSINRLNAVLDVGAVAMSASLFLWQPLLTRAADGVVGPLIAGAYPVADIALTGLALVFVISRRFVGPGLWLLAGAAVLTIGDLVYLIGEATDRYVTGGWPDPMFVIGPLIIAIAPFIDATEPHAGDADHRTLPSIVGLAAVVLALVALPVDFGLGAGHPLRPYELTARVFLRVLLLLCVAVRIARQAVQTDELIAEVRDTSSRINTIVDSTADAIILTDTDGKVLEWNSAAERLFDLVRSDVIGMSVFDFVQPESRAVVRDLVDPADLGRSREVTVPITIRNRAVPVSLRITPVNTDVGRSGYVVIAFDDTSRQMTAEAIATFSSLDPEHAVANFARTLHAYLSFDTLSLAEYRPPRCRELARVQAQPDDEARFETALTRLAEFDLPAEFIGEAPFFLIAGDAAAAANLATVGLAEAIVVPLREPTGDVHAFLLVGYRAAGRGRRRAGERLAALGQHLSPLVKNMLLYESERLSRQTSEAAGAATDDELARAADVQVALLPRTSPDIAGFEVAAWMKSSQRVGGDFFDWFHTGSGLNVCVADVMGKGMGGALLMATVRSTLRSTARDASLSERVELAAHRLADDLDQTDSFFTLFMAQLRPNENDVSFVDAGHGLAMVVRSNGAVSRLQSQGPPVGIGFDQQWAAETVGLARGDALVVFSDGYLDAHGPADSKADVDRILRDAARHVVADTDVKTIAKQLTEVDGDQPDDVTALVIRRR